MGNAVYQIPHYDLGPAVYTAAEAQDRIPWSITTHRVEQVWKETEGSGVRVAILDSGLWRHRDLPSPIFVENCSRSTSKFDAIGHSTHIAGIIAARRNGLGIVGIAPSCSLGCIKVLGDDGSSDDESLVRGIHAALSHNVDIINISLGGGYSKELEEACNLAISRGVFVICAAGNEGGAGDDTVNWPAKILHNVAVSSYNRAGKISKFSSRGPEVDIAFPGEAILSCWLNHTYREVSGTSMAAPFCSGVVALRLAYQRKHRVDNPITNNVQLQTYLREYAKDQGIRGHDNAWGWGVPDVPRLVYGRNPVT